MLAELRVERAEHGVGVHDDLVRRVHDLLGGERQAARRVQDDVDGDVVGREPQRALPKLVLRHGFVLYVR